MKRHRFIHQVELLKVIFLIVSFCIGPVAYPRTYRYVGLYDCRNALKLQIDIRSDGTGSFVSELEGEYFFYQKFKFSVSYIESNLVSIGTVVIEKVSQDSNGVVCLHEKDTLYLVNGSKEEIYFSFKSSDKFYNEPRSRVYHFKRGWSALVEKMNYKKNCTDISKVRGGVTENGQFYIR